MFVVTDAFLLCVRRFSLELKRVFLLRLIEPINMEKAVDLYQKAAGVFEVTSC